MAQSNKVIITCAVTGAIHTPSMSPYLPVTADQIAEAAIGAAEAGAAIVHLHARDEQTGRPDQTPEAFARFLSRIKQSTNAVINLTTGGAPFMTVQERVKPAETFKPEVASLNMGSMNFGLFPMLNRFKTFDHDCYPGATIHEMGTARMGRDPKSSVLNSHNQVWDALNVFVTDGASMASTACQNPSLTYMALTARASNHAAELLKAGAI